MDPCAAVTPDFAGWTTPGPPGEAADAGVGGLLLALLRFAPAIVGEGFTVPFGVGAFVAIDCTFGGRMGAFPNSCLPDVVDEHGIPYKVRFIRNETGATGYVSPYGAKNMTAFTVARTAAGLGRRDALRAVKGGA